MQKTRQQILDYLSNHSVANAKNLSSALGRTAANIRHHLAILEAEGFVQAAGESRLPRRGRPTKLFALTQKAHQSEVARLASVLWKELMGKPGSRERALRLDRIAGHLLSTYVTPTGALPRRLFSAVRRLEALGFVLHWEAHADAPRITIRRCPFMSLSTEETEVCELDQVLLQNALDRPIEQLAQRRTGPGGSPACVFRVL